MSIWVSFKVSCDNCHIVREEAWDSGFYSDEYVAKPEGWDYHDFSEHKSEKHPYWNMELLLCPVCLDLAKKDEL